MNIAGTNIASDKEKVPSWIWVLFAALLCVLFVRLGYLELSGEEPRRAVVAWEMLSSGEYIVPHAYGMEYYNKPPLYHWILACFMHFFGIHEFVVRLPGVLCFLAMGVGLFLWLRDKWGRTRAAVTSMIFYTSADLLLYATVFPAEIDLTFSFILMLQAIGVYRIGLDATDRTGYWIAYIGLAAAILTKGFIAIHFHVFALLAWTIYNGQLKLVLNKHHFFSFLSFLSILGLYYWTYSRAGNLTHLLLNNLVESTSKITDSSLSALINQVIETPLALLKISLPWTLALLTLYSKKVRISMKSDPIIMFSVLYILSNIWVYWMFVDVRDRYLYPFIPFLCVLVSALIYTKGWWPRKRRIIGILMAIMITLRLLYTIFALPRLADGRLSDDYIYNELVDTLLDKSNGQPIDLVIQQESNPLPFAYDGISEIMHQPLVPYQIPFYSIKKSNYAPQYVVKPEEGHHYLALASQTEIISKSEILFQFKEAWFGKQVVLIRYLGNPYK